MKSRHTEPNLAKNIEAEPVQTLRDNARQKLGILKGLFRDGAGRRDWDRFDPDSPDHDFELEQFEQRLFAAYTAAAKKEVDETEERYRRITEALTDYIFTVKIEDGRAIETIHGPGCIAVTGYSREEFSSDPFLWWRMVLPEDRSAVETQAQRVIDGISFSPLEHRILHKDGRVRWVRNTPVPRRDENGVLLSYDGLIQDITERKLTEEALAESEEKFRTIIENIEDGYFEVDLAGNFVFTNESLARILGFERDELSGMNNREYMDAENAQRVFETFNKVYLTGKATKTFDWKLIRKDGAECFVETSVSLKRDRDGRPTGFHGITRDITERKQAEEQQEKLQAQLNQAQKMESVGRLAGGVAHDFNNMLGVILGHIELALEKFAPLDQPLVPHLLEIRKAAERSANLTKQLLAFARKQIIIPLMLDLNETVEGMLEMMKRLIGEDIQLAWIPGKDLWQVKIDPSQVDQILANCCVNARDAIDGIGKITVETKNITLDSEYATSHAGFVPGDYVSLVISDNGFGMDQETLKNLFEPFFTTKAVGKGTGLGTAMVYGIVKQNKGFINVYSELGQGTSFSIYLPRHQGNNEASLRDEEMPPAVRGNETILLVEDELEILELTTTMLENQGYTVLPAATPKEAIELAENSSSHIDLLMTDVVMPEMNGRDLSGKLLSLHPGLKRLFMSGYTADVIADHGILDKSVNFIQKPFSLQDLAMKVREALEK